jgi:phosphate/sulfate permease
MGIDLFLIAVVILFLFAIFDLIVGVSNDAVNFLNSSIGSRVAPRYIIMIIASLGIMAGVAFSSGMMEVARKGIFHPQFFTMPEIMTIFLAVMLTDIILLDLFNTYGLPTSTTVSIVFELLGGAVAVSILKILQQEKGLTALADYINTSQAMIIIFGILLSVIVAFICGTIAQLLTRLLFTFEYAKKLKRFGALWGGVALAFITYFILVKGAKGATFISAEEADWIKNNASLILFLIFAVSAVILQVLLFFKINILKPIVLIGTFALAMAFAANDLVNFIGVPLAGFHAYLFAGASGSPLTVTMDALGKEVPTQTYMLLIAGLIMVITLWKSKKARTVTDTEVSLGSQGEGDEKFESIFISRSIVRMVIALFDFIKIIIPASLQRAMAKRLDNSKYKTEIDTENRPAFDLLRASVNLMVASAVISYATSQKLPLSTTYVTFMVAMGTSFADLAWGRESAVYRVTGVLTVIGGWFMTALLAFTVSGIMAMVIFYTNFYGILGLLIVVTLIIWRNHRKHSERKKSTDLDRVFNLKKVTSVKGTISVTFEQTGLLLKEIRESLENTFNALYNQNGYLLRSERKRMVHIQRWANIITANIFKTIRLMEKEHLAVSQEYGQTVRRLQKLVDGTRDIVLRCYFHVSNHHKGLLEKQIEDLKVVQQVLLGVISDLETAINTRDMRCYDVVVEKNKKLRGIAKNHNKIQIERIRNGESKTRLSILFYAIVGNAMMLSKQNLKLLEIFSATLSDAGKYLQEFDMD